MAQRYQTNIRADLASFEMHADLSVMAEGECRLDVALCVHGRSLLKQRFVLCYAISTLLPGPFL